MENAIDASNADACLLSIQSQLDYYRNILDRDKQASSNLIVSTRDHVGQYDDDEKILSLTGFKRIELLRRLDYFEHEASKTYEENRTCLGKLFETSFRLHHESMHDQLLVHQHRLADAFQYRPCLLPNVEKLRARIAAPPISNHSVVTADKARIRFTATPTPGTTLPAPKRSTSFSNRLDISAFSHTKASRQLVNGAIESNEIDLTQLIREAKPNNASSRFEFSKLSHYREEARQKSLTKRPAPVSIPCSNALLMGANKRHALLYNMCVTDQMSIVDVQTDDTKSVPWTEGAILSLGYIAGNLFYMITNTKIFLYDVTKETMERQYFLYDNLYKDFLPIGDDRAHRTSLKPSNQIPSTVDDDFCYYLYTNKDSNQILIKCSVDNFQQESAINLTRQFPSVECFLGLTVTTNALITFLVREGNQFRLLFCDESNRLHRLRSLKIEHASDPTKIVLTSSPLSHPPNRRQPDTTHGQHLWFVLDAKAHGVHCLDYEHYRTTIPIPSTGDPIESMSIAEDKLFVAPNQCDVQRIDLGQYFSSGSFD